MLNSAGVTSALVFWDSEMHTSGHFDIFLFAFDVKIHTVKEKLTRWTINQIDLWISRIVV